MPLQFFIGKLLILNYHLIAEQPSNADLYAISLPDFRAQINFLKTEQIPIIDLRKVLKTPLKADFAVAITIDDGNLSDYQLVRPVLKEHQIPASFFPPLRFIGNKNKIDWHQLRMLKEDGFEIGSHGVRHESISRLDPTQQEIELTESKFSLQTNLNLEVESFAFPYGQYNGDLVQQCFQKGYQRCFTTGLRINDLSNDTKLFYRWNITNRTDLSNFKKIVGSRGILSPAPELQSMITEYLKKSENIYT